MITYEEQKQILKEIEKRPDVRKWNVAAKVCQVLGWILLVFWIGIIFWIIGDRLEKKCKNLTNQLLARETARREGAMNNFENLTEERVAVKTDDGQGKVERLISLSNKNNKLTLLTMGIIVLVWGLLFFLPIGKVFGIEGISIFGLLKEKSNLGDESLLYALKKENWYITPSAIFFWVMGILFVLFFSYCLIMYFVGIDEKAIRENRGEIRGALTIQEIRAGTVGTAFYPLVVPFLGFGTILLYPTALLIAMQEVVTVHIVSCVVLGVLFLLDCVFAVLSTVLWLANKNEYQLLIGISATYKRNKRFK